jgi:S-adenosylmethionine hydrolase
MNFANIITLTTDFGLQDPYVGQMKGAILKRNVTARIVDLTHAVPTHDILNAAITIRTSYRYFPKGSIHLIVVDPGVGSQRDILAATGENHLFIAPDNGLLTLLAMDNKIEAVHRVENSSLFPSEISGTFHGRDIMAPVAAAIAAGLPLDKVGPETTFTDCVQLDIPDPVIGGQSITGEVMHIDHFGNIRTTITSRHFSQFQPSSFSSIKIGNQTISAISSTYAEQKAGELVALIDSSGYLEIAINRGNASEITGCEIGDPVTMLLEEEQA